MSVWLRSLKSGARRGLIRKLNVNLVPLKGMVPTLDLGFTLVFPLPPLCINTGALPPRCTKRFAELDILELLCSTY